MSSIKDNERYTHEKMLFPLQSCAILEYVCMFSMTFFGYVGHYRGSLKSLNTGIVTLLNYGKHVPPAVSHVTLAHEIGHNFGSPHDPEQCTPGGEDGNYIMFARATSGDKKNNNKFSPCSLKSIEPVLNAKARSPKGCFTEPQTSICGNGVVEPGEQCDCGWEEDCKDSCCFPMSRHSRSDEKPCTLTPKAMCSPSQGPCCTANCKLKFGDKCRDDNGCRDPSFCDGRMPQCPPSVNKPNKTICNKEFVCYMGECTGSICLAYGLESCQCIPGPKDDKIKSCELCCKLPGEENPCRSSFEWNEPPFDVPDMYAKPGTPCNDYNGYCDVFQKCREVDPSGPLATLRKLLLSEESIATFKKWIQHNWYTVVLAAVGVFILLIVKFVLNILNDEYVEKIAVKQSQKQHQHEHQQQQQQSPPRQQQQQQQRQHQEQRHHQKSHEHLQQQETIAMILSTKLLAKRSNLKLKSVTIIHSATTETVRLPEDNNGVIVHTAVRTKVPFKKKVRGERNANSNNNGSSSNNNNNNNGNKSKFAVVSGSKNPLKFHNNHIRGVTKMKTAASIGVTGAMTGSGGSTGNDIKKATRNKKKRATAQNIVNPLLGQTDKPAQTESGGKTKSKKLKKSSKEIIDYSSTRGGGSSGLDMGVNHTNTFGKVQKWLLESPIVAQPLSHIEHSSKVHKVISKSQSTPERLVQKTPTKSKSTGNLNNEKVKLQVVYKPPFKFALRLSKNTKIKTHIIGNPASNTNKFKRHSRSINMKDSKRCANSLRDDAGHGSGPGGTNSSGGGSGVKSLSEKTKRAALLLRSNNNEDNQILTLNEPNYETLNPKTAPSKMENPFYENLKFLQSTEKRHSDPNVESSSTTTNNSNSQATADPAAVKRSSSKSKMDIIQGSTATTSHHHFQRSLSSSNPFASDCMRSSRKFSETNANELSRNFGSTQNLIPSGHQTNLTKSKKRSSLNLKTSITKNGKDPPTKRSNSNMHLRRNSASNGAEVSKLQSNHNKVTQSQSHSQALKRSISNNAQQSSTHVLAKTLSSNCQAPSSAITQLPLYNAQRATRSSFSNIPRASLTLATNILASAASTVSNGHSSTSAANSNGSNSIGCAAGSNTPANLINNSINNFHLTTPASIAQVMQSAEQRRARNNLNQTMPGVQQHYQQQQQQRSNSIRQHAHNHHPPPLPISAISTSISSTTATTTTTTTAAAASNISHNSNDLTSDLEVLVSDIENLVS
ncbi:hypothetical protein GQX74_006630 [Glossina fuscipes]|nr:hypothetical protein GQX74_006630 [Glossina fuscipes]